MVIFWLYHAHDHENQDIYAGLIGGIVVTRKGRALPDGRPRDVDRELTMLFMIFDENKSPYLRANIEEFAQGRVWDPDDAAQEAHEKVDAASQEFRESNKKHAVNYTVLEAGSEASHAQVRSDISAKLPATKRTFW